MLKSTQASALRRRIGAPLILCLAALSSVACGGDDQVRAGTFDGMGGAEHNSEAPMGFGPCEPGDAVNCSANIVQANGVKSCFRGVKYCQDDGTWSDCLDPSVEP